MKKPVIISYDIETSYTVGAVWGLYEQNVATTLREPYMISFSYKILGENKTYVWALPDFDLYKKNKYSDKALVQKLKEEVFDKADIVIAHNGNSFDNKWSFGRMLVNSIKPPEPCKYIDTKLVAKRYFKFNSNSLNNLGSYLGIGNKVETGGIQLWVDCIENDKKSAWSLMKKYNKQDVVLLEKVYLKLLPYMDNHPRTITHDIEKPSCPKCMSHYVQKRGIDITGLKGKRQRYQCQDCAGWFKGESVK